MTYNTRIPLHPDDPNEMFIVRKGSTAQVTANLSEDELFNPKNGLDEHPLSMDTVRAVQAVRDYYGVPVEVMPRHSTYRNYIPQGEGVVDPVSRSPHMLAQAIDFSFYTDLKIEQELLVAVRQDWETKGPLFNLLWDMGVRGFGIYDSFMHLDTVRPALYAEFRNKRTDRYRGEQFAYWNKMKTLRNVNAGDGAFVRTLKEQTGIVAGLFSEIMISEDRGKDLTFKHFAQLAALILLPTTLVFGWFWLKNKIA